MTLKLSDARRKIKDLIDDYFIYQKRTTPGCGSCGT